MNNKIAKYMVTPQQIQQNVNFLFLLPLSFREHPKYRLFKVQKFLKADAQKKLLLAQQCDTKSLFVRNKQNCVSQKTSNPPKLRIKYFPKTLEKILLFRRFKAVRNAFFCMIFDVPCNKQRSFHVALCFFLCIGCS